MLLAFVVSILKLHEAEWHTRWDNWFKCNKNDNVIYYLFVIAAVSIEKSWKYIQINLLRIYASDDLIYVS